MGQKEGTNKHSVPGPHEPGLPPRAGGGPQGSGEGGFSRSSVHTPDTGGKAGLGREPLLSRPAGSEAGALPRLSSEVGLRASEVRRYRRTGGQLGSLGRVAGGHGAQAHRKKRKGRRGAVAALMLLSAVGYLQAEERRKAGGYPWTSGSAAHPAAGALLNPSPLLQAFPAHLSVCLCEKT